MADTIRSVLRAYRDAAVALLDGSLVLLVVQRLEHNCLMWVHRPDLEAEAEMWKRRNAE